MSTNDRIDAALDAFAAALDGCIGTGNACVLGTHEVARNTGVDDDTVRSYRDGRTVPSIKWVLRFTAAYRDRFPEMVARVWQAFEGVIGGRVDFDTAAHHGDTEPMRIVAGMEEKLARLLRALIDVTCPRSPGGRSITTEECQSMDPDLAALIVQADGLRLSVQRRTLTRHNRTA